MSLGKMSCNKRTSRPYAMIKSITNRKTNTSARSQARHGAAMVEFAIVLPFLLFLILGLIDLGRILMLNQMTTHASREALRRAIVPGMTLEEIQSTANFHLDSGGVSLTGREILVLDGEGNSVTNQAKLSQILSNEPVTIQITIPYNQNTWAAPTMMGSATLVKRYEMRRE